LLRNGSEGVAAEASGLVAMLIGGGPGDASMLVDTRGESHAPTCMQSLYCSRSQFMFRSLLTG
jgi:hypothetical protein